MKRDLNTIAYCDECGEPIYYDDVRYEMPDGKIICDFDPTCLSVWASRYRALGEVPLW